MKKSILLTIILVSSFFYAYCDNVKIIKSYYRIQLDRLIKFSNNNQMYGARSFAECESDEKLFSSANGIIGAYFGVDEKRFVVYEPKEISSEEYTVSFNDEKLEEGVVCFSNGHKISVYSYYKKIGERFYQLIVDKKSFEDKK